MFSICCPAIFVRARARRRTSRRVYNVVVPCALLHHSSCSKLPFCGLLNILQKSDENMRGNMRKQATKMWSENIRPKNRRKHVFDPNSHRMFKSVCFRMLFITCSSSCFSACFRRILKG